MRQIASSSTFAVDGIRSNEEILRREQERELLLSFSNDFAAIRDKDDLFKVISSRLKVLVGFSHVHICTLNKDHKTFSSYISDPLSKSNDHPLYADALKQELEIQADFVGKSYVTSAPVLFNLDEVLDHPELPFYFKMVYETGIRQIVVIRLSRAETIFGFWFLFFEQQTIQNRDQLSLLKGLSSQVSIAISNIIANTEIARREEEKSKILAFSNLMASVNDRHLLGKILKQQMTELFAMDECCLWVLSKDKKLRKPFLYDPESLIAKYPGFLGMMERYDDNTDSFYKMIMDSEKVLLLKIDDWIKLPGNIPYKDILQSISAKGWGGNIIRLADESIAIMTFTFNEIFEIKLQSSLYESICSQLAIAVSNLIGMEEIKSREIEKTKILGFSNAIASVNDTYQLGKIIAEQLRKIFNVKEYILWIVSTDKKMRKPFLFDQDAILEKYPVFQHMIGQYEDNTDPVYAVIMNAESVVLQDIDEWVKIADSHPCKDVVKALNLKGWGGNVISLAGENIAIMTVSHDHVGELKSNLSLYQSICSQLAIKVSDILGKEDIEKREAEKSLLLSLSTEIALLKSRDDLFNVVNKKVKELFSITQFGIAIINEDRITHSAFMMDLGHSDVYQAHFEHVTNSKYSVFDTAFQVIMNSDDPVVLDVEQLAKESDSPEYVKFWMEVGFKHLLCLALRTGGEMIGTMFFNMKPNSLNNPKTTLLKGICSQLSVAVSNILANEKVLYQLKEINKYKEQLEDEKVYLQQELKIANNKFDFIGSSLEMNKISRLISMVAPSESTVLILGETGTGKEVVAQAIHNNSTRKNKLMVKVNCATLPSSLIESELFGHERGSFTGAHDRRIGKFELAHHGTLFLDEIGEMPLELQAKLLRALQEKEIERLGGKATIKVDVRIIAATNRDLEKEMAEGRFRSDLYYRLNIFPINLPPLRSRQEDIPLLTEHFIQKFSKNAGKTVRAVTTNVMREMMRYSWPGNVRELEHLIERSVLLASGQTIKQIHLPVLKGTPHTESVPAFKFVTIDENERQHIFDTLTHCQGRITGKGGAAEILGVPASTLHSKMKRLGIVRAHVK